MTPNVVSYILLKKFIENKIPKKSKLKYKIKNPEKSIPRPRQSGAKRKDNGENQFSKIFDLKIEF